MIANLRGTVDAVGEDWLILDVGGVGYLLFCSVRTITALSKQSEMATLFVSTHVREDHIHFYGFSEVGEREWFLLLQTVQGVGARVGLAILSILPVDELVQAIVAQDKASVARANGVGPKLAGRIVTELRDKVGGLVLGGNTAVEFTSNANADVEEAISALVNLGYSRVDAFNVIAEAGKQLGQRAPLESLIRFGLKELSQ